MPDPSEERVYEEKLDRITELLEELVLDAVLSTLEKIRARNERFRWLDQTRDERTPEF
jgi:hypothetical protein